MATNKREKPLENFQRLADSSFVSRNLARPFLNVVELLLREIRPAAIYPNADIVSSPTVSDCKASGWKARRTSTGEPVSCKDTLHELCR